MKILFSVLIILLVNYKLLAQKIIISGKEGNRPLIWNDFKGKVNENSEYSAQTNWSINYKVANVQVVNKEVIIGNFEVVLELNPTNSWLKPGKASADLLKHEQGHFDTGILCMYEILKKKKETVFTPQNFKEKISSIFSETLAKYTALGIKYDEETNHSKIKDKQEMWNIFFENQLALSY